jgi:hypothetical protein
MRTIIAKASMALGVVCLCGFALYGQSYQLSAKIPFSFRVGNTILPAGQYELGNTAGKSVLQIRNRTTGHGNYISTGFGDENKAHQRNVLVFHRYGDVYFFSEMWNESGAGSKVPVSKSEKEYMTGSSEMAYVYVCVPARAD